MRVARARVAGRLPVVSTVRSLSPMSRVIRPHIMGACTWGSSRGVHVRLGVPGVYVDEDRAPNETIRTLSGRRGLDRQLSEYGRSPVGGGRSASATQYVSTVLVVGRPGSYARCLVGSLGTVGNMWSATGGEPFIHASSWSFRVVVRRRAVTAHSRPTLI
jgi:hypothetical protein